MDTTTAVAAALDHVQAWSNHDFALARAGLAEDVHVIALTTSPYPPTTDLHGIEDYMAGLTQFAQGFLPGSLRVASAIGDDRNALLTVTVEVDFGQGRTALPGARLYRFDNHGKIQKEQVIFSQMKL